MGNWRLLVGVLPHQAGVAVVAAPLDVRREQKAPPISHLTMMLTLARRTAPAVARASASRCTARALSSYFAESHEYAKVDGGVATVGITEFAANALGDIVFVDLPEVGDEVEKGESFGAVESVKAASDVYARSPRPRRRRARDRGPRADPSEFRPPRRRPPSRARSSRSTRPSPTRRTWSTRRPWKTAGS